MVCSKSVNVDDDRITASTVHDAVCVLIPMSVAVSHPDRVIYDGRLTVCRGDFNTMALSTCDHHVTSLRQSTVCQWLAFRGSSISGLKEDWRKIIIGYLILYNISGNVFWEDGGILGQSHCYTASL